MAPSIPVDQSRGPAHDAAGACNELHAVLALASDRTRKTGGTGSWIQTLQNSIETPMTAPLARGRTVEGQ